MRARSAVSRPSSSQPAQYSIRIGWRFGWMRSDSSRDSVHFTGRPVSHAASAVWAWFDMSSLPPNAPPFATSSTVTLPASMPSTDAIWSRSSQTPWPPDQACSPSVPSGSCDRGDERRLGLEERVLDALRLEHLVHDVRARRERRIDVAPRVRRARQHVALEAPDRVVASGLHRGDWVDDRRKRSVLDVDELRRGPRRLAVLGDDHREHVAEIGRAPTLRDEDRPVLVDQTDAQRSRHVGGGEHPHDARAPPPRH